MEARKPRPTRFEADNPEARLAQLRDQAPTLAESRRLRWYAIFGSILMLLTVAAFYVAMQIYKVASEPTPNGEYIEVDQAPEVEISETEKALLRAQEEEIAAQKAYQDQLESLKKVDLLQESEPPKP